MCRSSPPAAAARRLEDVMKHVPGIETANYEIVETKGSVEELTQVFAGAKVVCNTAGPFIYNGPRVIEAALNAGCHYLDIGGEQAWVRTVAEKWGCKFAQRGLLAAPATAFMSAVSDSAIRLCLENNRGIDTLEVLTMFKGNPDLRLDPDHLRRDSNRCLLSGAEHVQTLATRHPLRCRRARQHPNSARLGLGRVPASGLVQRSSADSQHAILWWTARPADHGRRGGDGEIVRGADPSTCLLPNRSESSARWRML
jgi:hypothetical protein